MVRLTIVIAMLVIAYFNTRKIEDLVQQNRDTYNKFRVKLWTTVLMTFGVGFIFGTFL